MNDYETLEKACDELFLKIKEITNKSLEDTYLFRHASLLKTYLNRLKYSNGESEVWGTSLDIYNYLVTNLEKYASLLGSEVSFENLNERLKSMLAYKGIKFSSDDTLELLKKVRKNYKEYNYSRLGEFCNESTLTIDDIIEVVANKTIKRSDGKVVFLSGEETTIIIDEFIEYLSDYEYFGLEETKKEIEEKYADLFGRMLSLTNISFESSNFDFISFVLSRYYPCLESKLNSFITIYNDLKITDLNELNSIFFDLEESYQVQLVNNVFSSLAEATNEYNEYQTELFNLKIKEYFFQVVDEIIESNELKIKNIMDKHDISYENTLKLINILEKEGIISDFIGKRRVIVTKETWEEKKNNIEVIPLKDEFLYQEIFSL